MVRDHLGNEFKSIKEMCEVYGVDYRIAIGRRHRGWTIEDILTKPDRKSYTVKDHLGNEFCSIGEMCRHYEVNKATFLKRIKSGQTLEEALTKQKQIYKDHIGNEFKSINEMCRYYGINKVTFYMRIKSGWTLEEALTDIKQTTIDRTYKDHLGNEFSSVPKMVYTYGIDYGTYRNRINSGWTLQNALEIPTINARIRLKYRGLDGEQYFYVGKPVNAYMNREQIKEYASKLNDNK